MYANKLRDREQTGACRREAREMSEGVKICVYAIIFIVSHWISWIQKEGIGHRGEVRLPSQKYIHRDECPENEQPDWHTHSISEVYENIPL